MERNVLPVTMRLALGNDDADIHTCKHIPHQHAAHNPHTNIARTHIRRRAGFLLTSPCLFLLFCALLPGDGFGR